MVVNISWIEANNSERIAIWIDGYIPNSERIKPKLRDLYSKREDSYTDKGWTHIDYLIRNFLCDHRLNFHRKASKKGQAEFHLCDLFYSKVLPFSELPAVFKNITPFYEDIINEESYNYRQLIVTYEPEFCSVGKSCTKNLLKELEFELKEPNSYENYKEFNKTCLKILDYIVEAYEAPCIVASDRLKKMGFLAECDQS